MFRFNSNAVKLFLICIFKGFVITIVSIAIAFAIVSVKFYNDKFSLVFARFFSFAFPLAFFAVYPAPPYTYLASLTDSNDAFDTSGIVQLDSDYSFTIDNTQSYADIPVTTEKGTPLS